MKDDTVFEGKSLQDLLQDIYNNTLSKRLKLLEMIDMFKKFIKTPDDAVIVGPIIKDFFDVLVKNDDHLIKVATIIQRIISAESYKSGATPENYITDDERERLLREAVVELEHEVARIESQIDTLPQLPASLGVKSV
jgi:hypothetical protein